MENTKKETLLKEARISNVPTKTLQTLNNIARNEGQTFSGFMKSQLKKIIASYPDNMKVAEN